MRTDWGGTHLKQDPLFRQVLRDKKLNSSQCVHCSDTTNLLFAYPTQPMVNSLPALNAEEENSSWG